jgi:hypothetical protein
MEVKTLPLFFVDRVWLGDALARVPNSKAQGVVFYSDFIKAIKYSTSCKNQNQNIKPVWEKIK